MSLARLEIEIDNGCDLVVRCEDRRGQVIETRGDEAWRTMDALFPRAPAHRLEGTLTQLRNRYILELVEADMGRIAMAKRLGVSVRALTNYLKELQENDVPRHGASQTVYEGTLDEIRRAYIRQLDARATLTEIEKADILGVTARTLREWKAGRRYKAPKKEDERAKAKITLAPHANEAYEEKALRASGTDG